MVTEQASACDPGLLGGQGWWVGGVGAPQGTKVVGGRCGGPSGHKGGGWAVWGLLGAQGWWVGGVGVPQGTRVVDGWHVGVQ